MERTAQQIIELMRLDSEGLLKICDDAERDGWPAEMILRHVQRHADALEQKLCQQLGGKREQLLSSFERKGGFERYG